MPVTLIVGCTLSTYATSHRALEAVEALRGKHERITIESPRGYLPGFRPSDDGMPRADRLALARDDRADFGR